MTQIEIIAWIVLGVISAIVAAAVIRVQYCTRPQTRVKAQEPQAVAVESHTAVATEPLIAITVEFGQRVPGSGMLLLAAYRALREGDGEKRIKYNMLYSVRANKSRTFYFAEK